MFSTKQQWTATFELKKEGVNIILFQSGITSENTKVQIFKFLLQVSFSYLFRGVMFKEHLWPRKSNKNIAFVGKERKEIFFGETKRCSAKILVGSCSTKDHWRIHLCE